MYVSISNRNARCSTGRGGIPFMPEPGGHPVSDHAQHLAVNAA